MDPNRRDTQALLEAAKNFGDAQELTVVRCPDEEQESALVVALPEGRRLHSVKKYLDEWADSPTRKEGFSVHQELASLCAHIDRHGPDETTAVFVDRDEPAVIAVYNYTGESDKGPEFCDYGAKYPFPISDEWEFWLNVDKRSYNIAEFAELLEDRLQDVMDPAQAGASLKEFASRFGVELAGGAKLLALSNGLSINVKHSIVDTQNRANGDRTIMFQEKSDKPADGVDVPKAFAISIPVFRGGDRYQVPVHLRFKAGGDGIRWSLKPHRMDVIFDDAINGAAEVLSKHCPHVYRGKPERKRT